MSGLRAITVRQPWGETIAPGGKDVENRSAGALGWQWRDWLLIHVGVGWSDRGALDHRVRAYWGQPGLGRGAHSLVLDDPEQGRPERPSIVGTKVPLPYQVRAGIALCTLDDIHEGLGCCDPWGEDVYQAADGRRVARVAHLVLGNIWRLPRPIPIQRGRLGLWDPGEDVAVQCLNQAIDGDWSGLVA